MWWEGTILNNAQESESVERNDPTTSQIEELTEDELEQVSGGTPNSPGKKGKKGKDQQEFLVIKLEDVL